MSEDDNIFGAETPASFIQISSDGFDTNSIYQSLNPIFPDDIVIVFLQDDCSALGAQLNLDENLGILGSGTPLA
jgi:hypothetical protein